MWRTNKVRSKSSFHCCSVKCSLHFVSDSNQLNFVICFSHPLTDWRELFLSPRVKIAPCLDTLVSKPLDLLISSWLCAYTMSQANKTRSHHWQSQTVRGSLPQQLTKLTSNIMSCEFSTITVHQQPNGAIHTPDQRLQQYFTLHLHTSTAILHSLWSQARSFCMWGRAHLGTSACSV